MNYHREGIYLLAVSLLGLCGGMARGQTLYGIANGSQLITINTTTGTGTLVGSTGMGSWGMAFRGSKLYAWDVGASLLRELDPATAATLNTIDIGLTASSGGDLTFRSDGIGFIAKYGPSELVRFDVTVPSSTVVGPLIPSMFGLAFNPADVLYGLASGGATLHTINPTTGAATFVGNTGLPGMGNGSLAFDSAGNLFAALGNPVDGSSLYRIDPSTAAVTLIGSTGFTSVGAISFPPAAPPPPPPPPPPTPPAPPAPQPPAGGDEGSFPGSAGPRGAEGAFGQGGRGINTGMDVRFPVLLGPFLQRPISANQPGVTMVVFNVAHREKRQISTHGASQERLLGCVFLSAIAVSLSAVLLVWLTPRRDRVSRTRC